MTSHALSKLAAAGGRTLQRATGGCDSRHLESQKSDSKIDGYIYLKNNTTKFHPDPI